MKLKAPRQVLKALLTKAFHLLLGRLSSLHDDIQSSNRQVQKNSFLLADILIRNIRTNRNITLRDSEFSVFSQWGQDGIIQYLIDRVPLGSDTFIEFGVEDYIESNTRFLMMHDNWSGLVIDGSELNINAIKKRDLYWRYDLTAIRAFITRENINELIGRRFRGDVGVLSIDIDGNDYWIWEAIEVVSPRIVICEYNSVFGLKRAVTIPYDPKFFRTSAHYSNLYFGASLLALYRLAIRKGYVFVGCTQAGNDAFFVRKDVAQNITALTAEEGYILSKARESRDPDGHLTFVSGEDRLRLISDMQVFDLERQKLLRLSDL
jgi:hypothetical protein